MPSPQQRSRLVEEALQARQRAYAPYSRYQVGAAVLTADDQIYVGCNVENAAYPATICAERVALTSAVANGQRDFVALAVATADGGTPCGICRQVMAELGPAMEVYLVNGQGQVVQSTTVKALLPDFFSAASLIAGAPGG